MDEACGHCGKEAVCMVFECEACAEFYTATLRARVAKLERGLYAFVFDVYASGESLPPKSLSSFMKHIVPLDADAPSTDGGDRGA